MHIDLKAYQDLAMRTAKKMDTMRDQLLHGALGCCTEPGELALTTAAYAADANALDMKNVVEELGDGMWFAAYVADAMGTNLHDVTNQYQHEPIATDSIGELVLRYCAAGSDIGTLVKAYAFYNKPFANEQLLNNLSRYVNLSGQICSAFGLVGVDVLKANIEKLTKRYPEKYSDQAAIARADKVEDSEGAEMNAASFKDAYVNGNSWEAVEHVPKPDTPMDQADEATAVERTVAEDGSPSSVN